MNSTNSSLNCNGINPKSQLALIEKFVSLTFLLSVLMFIIGNARRLCSGRVCLNTPLKDIALLVNFTVASLIPYLFGLVRNLGVNHALVSIWATFLVFVYARLLNVSNVKDKQSTAFAFTNFILYSVYASLVQLPSEDFSLKVPLLLILLLSEFHIITRIWFSKAPVYPSYLMLEKNPLLRNIAKYIGTDGPNNQDAVNPLIGCKYAIHPEYIKMEGNFIVDRGITIHKIWTCNDGSIFSAMGDKSLCLKSTCLSFSLFWLLLHKFEGLQSYESMNQDEAWRFVQRGLIDQKEGEHLSPFRVIEVELAFLRDCFVPNGCLFYRICLLFQLAAYLMFLLLVCWIVALLFINYHPGGQTVRIQYHKYDMDVLVTGIVIILITLVETAHFRILCFSRWSKMLVVCAYLHRESWRMQTKWDCCVKKIAEFVCRRCKLSEPPQRKLGQYSFLSSYSYCGLQNLLVKIYCLQFQELLPVKMVDPGRKQSNSISLSNTIKKAVLQPLIGRDHPLTNGIHALQYIHHDLSQQTKTKLIQFCSEREADAARDILAWHIATYLCDNSPTLSCAHRRSDDFHVAISLSNYCAYLVAFAPDLLPGQASMSRKVCTLALGDASSRLKYSQPVEIYHKLSEIAREDSDEVEAGRRNTATAILTQGAILGKVLETEITDPEKRWKVLADVWAERILYLAPNLNNEGAHLERLEDGGEFITLLWALLFHAGIVDRESNLQLHAFSQEASTETSSTAASDRDTSTESCYAAASDGDASAETSGATASDRDASTETNSATASDGDASIETSSATASDEDASTETNSATASDGDASSEICNSRRR